MTETAKPGELTATYREVAIEDVLWFWVKAYAQPVEQADWWFDPVKGKVMFRLYVRAATPTEETD